jgi:hypothetical protein
VTTRGFATFLFRAPFGAATSVQVSILSYRKLRPSSKWCSTLSEWTFTPRTWRKTSIRLENCCIRPFSPPVGHKGPSLARTKPEPNRHDRQQHSSGFFFFFFFFFLLLFSFFFFLTRTRSKTSSSFLTFATARPRRCPNKTKTESSKRSLSFSRSLKTLLLTCVFP